VPLGFAILFAIAFGVGRLLSNALGVGEVSGAVDVLVSGVTGAVVGYAFGWWRQRRGNRR
jgi:fucose permease